MDVRSTAGAHAATRRSKRVAVHRLRHSVARGLRAPRRKVDIGQYVAIIIDDPL